MDRPVDTTPTRRRRTLILAVGVAIVMAVGIAACPSVIRWTRSEASVELDRLRIGAVSRGDLVRDVSVEGRVVAAFHPTAFSPADGIVSVLVEAGVVVAADQELARVASPELESRLEQERASLAAFRADLERQRIRATQSALEHGHRIALGEVELEAAQRAMERAVRSRELGIVNAVEYETAEDGLKVAELELESTRRMTAFASEAMDFEVRDRSLRFDRQQLLVSELERQVAALVVRAPVAGLVSRVHVEDREAVSANAALVTVVDLSAFEVEIEVAESYASLIVPGTEAVMTVGSERYGGQVSSIAPEVHGNLVRGVVAFSGAAPQGLKQNQRLTTRLILETRPDVLKLPRGPFLDSGGGRRAFVVGQGMAERREIEIGAVSVSEVEVVSGLEVGEQVIVSDTSRFQEAQRVLLR